MADELELLQELCADLVSERRHESALIRLFQEKSGGWLALDTMCVVVGVPVTGTQAVATWLSAPGEPDYAVVLFYDPDTLWSTTALYNTSRLHKSPGLIGSGVA